MVLLAAPTCRRYARPVLALVLFCGLSTASDAVDALATGVAFDRQLESPLTANWANVTFREVVESLQAARQIGIVIDRRIDADEPFSLQCKGDSLAISLQKMAVQKQVGVSILRPVVYFGPAKATEQLRTLSRLRHEEIIKLPAAVRRRMSGNKAAGWSQLAEPRALVVALADEAQTKVVNPEVIPHDLWPAVKLPAMAWSDRLTLVLIQFGLTFEISGDGKALKLLPIPERVEVTKSYPGGAEPTVRAAKLAKLMPNAHVEKDGDRIVVVGREEDHAEVTALLAGRPVRTATVGRGKDLYTLKIQGLPLEKVLIQLGEMLKLELDFDREAIAKTEASLDQLISFQVENASLDELLTAALKETGMEFERNGMKVKIKPTSRD